MTSQTMTSSQSMRSEKGHFARGVTAGDSEGVDMDAVRQVRAEERQPGPRPRGLSLSQTLNPKP
eukprot:880054-Rhodomonas_salina.1